MSARLDQATYCIHRHRSHPHQYVTGTDDVERSLHFQTPVRDRVQDLRNHPRVTSQLFGVELIALAIAVSNSSDFTSVRHQHFVTELAQMFIDPQ